jgi:predicted AAA+ superfamily ATPase
MTIESNLWDVNMPRIEDALVEQNPWWKGRFVLDYKPRSVYDRLRPLLKTPQIVSLTGIRRAGKTTLLQKAASDALSEGTDPKTVLYFSFDEFRQEGLRPVLDAYERLLGQDLRQGRHLVLLDELQKVDGWENSLKALYDVHKGRVKFLISGSEGLFIRSRGKETLAGRLFELNVDPLSFKEFLDFKGERKEPSGLYERELEALFWEYIRSQGFPEMVGIADRTIIRKYLRESIVEKVLFRDIPAHSGIKDPSSLESIINILMDEPGQMIKLSELGGELGLSRRTLSAYLSHLENSFLVRKLYNYSTGRRKSERKLKKYYPAIISPDLTFAQDDLSRSRVLEWCVVTRLGAEYFWRDSYKNEVDVVVPGPRPMPIEVKYGRIETGGVEAFMNRFKVRNGTIISTMDEGVRKTVRGDITIRPAFKFLIENRAK